ncbi:MAG: acyltransferase family protein [Pseudomonadota bacterium]
MPTETGERAVTGHGPAYRPDVDGLRAIAVSAVVLYHAAPEWLPGGFLGVDIFFVISGYLITSIIAAEMRAGTYTLAGFYERRIRRILPALLLVLAVTSAAAYLLLLPDDLKQYAKSVLATLGFVANHHFYLQTGYFAGPADTLPLLHTWSLAVEEQFYIVWPLLLAVLHARIPGRIVGAIVGLAVASLALQLVAARHWPEAAFFFAPMRAWQLLIGCYIALAATGGPRTRASADAASIVGLALVLTGLVHIPTGLREAGLAAAGPCLGAALLVWSSANGPSLAGRLLSLGPFVLVGLVSYSLYLWHWPLFALARYRLDRDLSGIETLAIVVAALLLALATWRFVERPFRRRRGGIPLTRVLGLVAAAALPLAAVSVLATTSKGMPWRWPGEVRELLAKAEIYGLSGRRCLDRAPDDISARGVCRLNEGAADRRRMLVWGDSHAESLIPVLATLAKDNGTPLWYGARSACPPLQDSASSSHPKLGGESCKRMNALLLAFAISAPLDDVVLIARWNYYAAGPEPFGVDRGTQPMILADDVERGTAAGNASIVERGLRKTIAPLVAAGRRVFVVLQVPYTGIDTPAYLAKHAIPLRGVTALPLATIHAQRSMWMRDLAQRLAAEYGVVVIDPSRALCDRHSCRIGVAEGSLYRDDDHLNHLGAHSVAGELKRVLEWPVGAAPR